MRMTLSSLSLALAGSVLLMSSFAAQAKGGVALGATRLIYPEGQKEISVALTNTSPEASYLVQSWITTATDQKTQDYILTPPLFVSKPKSENTLRVMYAGPALPTDRESVFYLHSRSIPSIDKSKLTKSNVLQIAIESVIKVFWRPKGLPLKPDAAPALLTCHQGGNAVTIKNPSPYYLSLVSLYTGTRKLPNTMIPPKGETTLQIPGGKGGAVTFKNINDYGAMSGTMTCSASGSKLSS
ncbi:fimbria/pilus periplasmic chaperone [Klebsiella aerogenes]|uniref:fimbria/pilus periplasmic chaperone n=1 Tax=Klebsiella aerogenes TaxID=548 RepID=UPI001F1D8747|nr:fimbria/pilus periplasmic chaperone [Klebsiella aerogenes]